MSVASGYWSEMVRTCGLLRKVFTCYPLAMSRGKPVGHGAKLDAQGKSLEQLPGDKVHRLTERIR